MSLLIIILCWLPLEQIDKDVTIVRGTFLYLEKKERVYDDEYYFFKGLFYINGDTTKESQLKIAQLYIQNETFKSKLIKPIYIPLDTDISMRFRKNMDSSQIFKNVELCNSNEDIINTLSNVLVEIKDKNGYTKLNICTLKVDMILFYPIVDWDINILTDFLNKNKYSLHEYLKGDFPIGIPISISR